MKNAFMLICAILFAFVAHAADTYTVVGSSQLQGGGDSWSVGNTSGNMTANGDGSYSLILENVALEANTTYEYKVVKNHTWNSTTIHNNEWSDNGSNCKLTVPETAKYKVVITLVPDEANKNVPQTTATKTGEIGEITHTYTVAGGERLFTDVFNPKNDAGKMSLDEKSGLYTLVIKNRTLKHIEDISAGDHSDQGFKVCVDGGWSPSYPSENWIVNPETDGDYDVTITFDASTHDIKVDLAKTTVTTHTYSLYGSIKLFGSDWDVENAMEMTPDGNVYKASVNGVTLWKGIDYKFKVIEDGKKDNSFPVDENGTIKNATVSVSEDGIYNVDFTFNATTKEITATPTKTGNATADRKYYVVGGKTLGFTPAWTLDAAKEMTLDDKTGVYRYDLNYVDLTKIENQNDGGDYSAQSFKVLLDKSFDATQPDGSNYIVNCPADGKYTVTVAYNPASSYLNAYVYDVAAYGDAALFGHDWDQGARVQMSIDLASGTKYNLVRKNVTLAKGTHYQYKVIVGGDTNNSYPEGEGNNATITVDKDGVYDVAITFDAQSNTTTATPTFVKDAAITHDYYLVGSADLGLSWTAAEARKMTRNETTGKYECTLTSVSLSKVDPFDGKDHSNQGIKVLDNKLYSASYPFGDKNNYIVNPTADGTYDVVISFDPSADDEDKLTCTFNQIISHTYSIYGAKELVGGESDWDVNNAKDMQANGKDTYTLALTNLTLARNIPYQFKVMVDGDTNNSYPNGMGQNENVTVGEDGIYTVTITFNASTHAITSSYNKTGDIQIEHKYYVVGGESLGLSWKETEGAEMTLNNTTGLYEYVIEKATLKHIANTSDDSYKATQDFKILDNRSWSAAYPDGDNYVVNPENDGRYKVTITFDPSNSKVDCKLEKVVVTGVNAFTADDNTFVNIPVYNLSGERVGKDYKGVVIVRGKKYLWK